MKRKSMLSLGSVAIGLWAVSGALGAQIDQPACDAVGTAVVTVTSDASDAGDVQVIAFTSDDGAQIVAGDQMILARTSDDDGENVKVRVLQRSAGAVDANRGWLGVALGEIKTDSADAPDVAEGSVRIINVVEDSPASEAGLLKDDVVTAINGEPISGVADLAKHIGDLGPGAAVDFTIMRDGQASTLTVTLGSADRGDVKWIHEPSADFDVHFFDRMKTGPQIIELSPMGKLRFLSEEDLKDLDDLPGIVADALSSMKVSIEVKIDDGERTIELSTVRDGTTISVEQTGDGPISVKRSSDNGANESVDEYADADALAAGDSEAYELYQQVPMDGKAVFTTINLDDQDFDFDVSQWIDEDVNEKIHERLQEAMPHLQSLPHSKATWFHQVGKASHSFKVTPNGQIELTIRKGDTEVVQVFSSEEDLAQRDPDLYDRYLDVVDADLE